MSTADEVIDRPPEEGARVVALALLSEARAAADRMARGSDDEALHDFRVALRRLRSALRAYRPWLEADVSRKMERKLKRLARATNASRDAEVQLAWVRSRRDAVAGPRQQVGLDFAIARLEAARRDAKDPARLAARLHRQSEKLARRLGAPGRRVKTTPRSSATFGGVLAALAGDQLVALRQRLDTIAGPLDERTIHEARIQGKRLRYLLEPLRGNRHADARPAVRRLKRLQDLLGELHDGHVLAHELADAQVRAASRRARQRPTAVHERGAPGGEPPGEPRGSPRPGLLALTRLLRERRGALFADLQRDWRAGGFERLAREVGAVAAALEARAVGRRSRSQRSR